MAVDADTLAHIKETTRRFVRERLVPLEAEVAEEDRIPDAVIDEMRTMGLFGMSVPTDYGGLGLDMVEEATIVMELGWTSPAFRSVLGTNVGIGAQGIVMDGTEEQKRRYLPGIASGELIASFALTEPDAGSDAKAVRTTARKDGADYVLNGTKRYITNAPRAGVFTVMARTDAGNRGAGGVSAFLVDAGTPGLTVAKPDRKMGQKGAHTADVIFEECRVPASAIIGGVPGQGFRTAMKVLERGRIHIAALCVGVADRLIEESLSYGLNRRQFGERIANFQLIQAMIADSKVEAYAARCMVMDSARRLAAGEKIPVEASCCKLFASEAVGRIADRAVQIHGGAGYMADYAVERFYRDVRLFRIYEGTSQIQQLVIAGGLIRDAEARL